MSDMVEVLVNSIQQPEEEFLGIVLGVPLELESALGHHILQHTGQKKSDVSNCSSPKPDFFFFFSSVPRTASFFFFSPLPLHEIFSASDQDGGDQHNPKGQRRRGRM